MQSEGAALSAVATRPRVLSGMRPTGPLHLGHLVGALQNWVRLQDDHECYFPIVDWHALTTDYADPRPIQGWVREVALPDLPDEFRSGFLQGNPINRALLARATPTA